MGGLFFLSVILRLIFDKEMGRQFLKAKRSLIGGMALLSLGYLLGGVGIDGYFKLAANNLLFAAVQVASVAVMYVLFTGAVRWEKAPKDYFSIALQQCGKEKAVCGSIMSEVELYSNIAINCIPEDIFEMDYTRYMEFLEKRRVLMAKKIRSYYESL
jgi:hypothetical protein